MSNFSGHSVELLSILSVLERYKLRVPDYQRQYSWPSEPVEDLLNDINAIDTSKERYRFLGYLTICEIDHSKNIYWLIDGQQRLTTMSLVLSNLSESMKSAGLKNEANDIVCRYIYTEQNELESYKFLPASNSPQSDRASLVNHYVKMVVSEAEEDNEAINETIILPSKDGRITWQINNLLEANAIIRKFFYNKGVKWLKEYQEKLLSTSVVLHIVKDEANGAEIFDGINNRGLQLSELDKVRCLILYYYKQASPEGELAARIDKLSGAFSDVFPLLYKHKVGRLDELDLVNSILPCMVDTLSGQFFSNSNGVNDIRSILAPLPQDESLRFLDVYIERLVELVRYYGEFVRAQDDSYNEFTTLKGQMITLSRGMTFLRRSKLYAPLVMSFRRYNASKNGSESGRKLMQVLRFLERLSVHRVVREGRVHFNAGAKHFISTTIRATNGSWSADRIIEDITSIFNEDIFSHDDFKERLSTIGLNEASGSDKVAYILGNWLIENGFKVYLSTLKKLLENRTVNFFIKPQLQNVYGRRNSADTELERFAWHPINFWHDSSSQVDLESLLDLDVEQRCHLVSEKFGVGHFYRYRNRDLEAHFTKLLSRFLDFSSNRWGLDDPGSLWNTTRYPLNYQLRDEDQEVFNDQQAVDPTVA